MPGTVMACRVSTEMPHEYPDDMAQFDFESCSGDLGFPPRGHPSSAFPQKAACPGTLFRLLYPRGLSKPVFLVMTRSGLETTTRQFRSKLDHLSAYLSGWMNVSSPSILIHTQLDPQIEYRKEAVKWTRMHVIHESTTSGGHVKSDR
jgi:hypothetical protein